MGEGELHQEDDFWFPCRKCGKREYLIRGLCSECAPVLHQTHDLQMKAYDLAAKAFEMETGKKPLSAWYEFEEWCDRKSKQK